MVPGKRKSIRGNNDWTAARVAPDIWLKTRSLDQNNTERSLVASINSKHYEGMVVMASVLPLVDDLEREQTLEYATTEALTHHHR